MIHSQHHNVIYCLGCPDAFEQGVNGLINHRHQDVPRFFDLAPNRLEESSVGHVLMTPRVLARLLPSPKISPSQRYRSEMSWNSSVIYRRRTPEF
jgi:hypothetical protein